MNSLHIQLIHIIGILASMLCLLGSLIQCSSHLKGLHNLSPFLRLKPSSTHILEEVRGLCGGTPKTALPHSSKVHPQIFVFSSSLFFPSCWIRSSQVHSVGIVYLRCNSTPAALHQESTLLRHLHHTH
jgi:hypothetical protein